MLNLLLTILFCNIDLSVVVEIVSIIASSMLSIVAIAISVKTLKQSNEAIIETSRANIVFYVDTLTGGQQFLVLKNFGNAMGEILDIDVYPKLDYSKSPKINCSSIPVITDYKNITLAPKQCIKSWFPFSSYPDTSFKITVKYKTLGKEYKETYPINLSYIKAIDYIRKENHNSNVPKALDDINTTLQNISERF